MAATDSLFQGRRSRTNDWNRQLSVQVELFGPADLSLLHNEPAFASASRILEIGCGNGAFLHTLSRHFPEKSFVGVDLSSSLLALAQRDHHAENIEYRRADVYEMRRGEWGTFDFIIARFLVQHLPSLSGFLDTAANLLPASGTLLVYDTADDLAFLRPHSNWWSELFLAAGRHQAMRSVGRNAIEKVVTHHRRHGFSLLRAQPLIHAAVRPYERQLLRDFLAQCADTVRNCLQVPVDVIRGHHELNRWFENPWGYGQFGTRAVVLRRRLAGAYSLPQYG